MVKSMRVARKVELEGLDVREFAMQGCTEEVVMTAK